MSSFHPFSIDIKYLLIDFLKKVLPHYNFTGNGYELLHNNIVDSFSPPKKTFLLFKEIWKEKKFYMIQSMYDDSHFKNKCLEEMYSVCLGYFVISNPDYPNQIKFWVRVGALYTLYCLYFTQNPKNKVKIEVSPKVFEKILNLTEDLKKNGCYEGFFILNRLTNENCYCYSSICKIQPILSVLYLSPQQKFANPIEGNGIMEKSSLVNLLINLGEKTGYQQNKNLILKNLKLSPLLINTPFINKNNEIQNLLNKSLKQETFERTLDSEIESFNSRKGERIKDFLDSGANFKKPRNKKIISSSTQITENGIFSMTDLIKEKFKIEPNNKMQMKIKNSKKK